VRRDRVRLLGAAALAAVAALGAVALGSRSLTARADFAFCNQQEIQSLDPAVTSGVPEARILTALYEGLVRADPRTGAPIPGMAESWSVSADGLTWTFALRGDSRWTNGDPVTARDFEYSFRRVLDPRTAAPYADSLWCLRGAQAFSAGTGGAEALGLRAPDDRTLVLELERPTPQLPALLLLAPLLPVHRGCVETWGREWIRPEHIVTNGPFRLVERRVRDRLRLARHEGYWGAADVALATIDAYAADGITTQLNMYLTGQVDWMVKPPTSLYDSVLARPDAIRGPQAGATFLRFNTTRAPFDDPRVRRALALALDREALARDIMRGGELPATSFVPAGLGMYVPATLAPADADAARALLAQAGYPGGAGFPEFELLYPAQRVDARLLRGGGRAVARPARAAAAPRQPGLEGVPRLDAPARLRRLVGRVDGRLPRRDELPRLLQVRRGQQPHGLELGALRRAARAGQRAAGPARARGAARAGRGRAARRAAHRAVYQRICLNLVSGRVRGFHDNVLDLHPLRDLSISP
jgi:oligopeptide transport system substrate-binding protein